MRRRAWSAGLLVLAGGFARVVQAENVNSQKRSLVSAHVIAVGPGRTLRNLGEAARLAQDGDTFEVDAGEYPGDVAVWEKDRLTVRAVGGRVRLLANGRNVEGKGIWVVRGGEMRIEGFDFIGARVPDRNGAGIRFEKGRLTVSNCRFLDNENGILTSQDAAAELCVEFSEFGHNGFGDGYSHNLYVGRIARLTVTGSYFHHARVGHLLKSRAGENHVLYNRLTDENGGRASYELEFPNGGIARVVGNLIQQGAKTANATMLSYGAEGYLARTNDLLVSHNTFVDQFPGGGVFLSIRPGARRVRMFNNLMVGDAMPGEETSNDFFVRMPASSDHIADIAALDYRLLDSSRLIGRAKTGAPFDARPDREYAHPRAIRMTGDIPLQPGALHALASRSLAR